MDNAVRCEREADGLVLAVMDLPGRPMNVVGEALVQGLEQALQRLSQPDATGLILCSGKADFCAGGDLDRIAAWRHAQEAFDAAQAMKAVLRRLETQGKPVVAAIQGHALGGGLEIALACHARFVLDDPALKLGQPEIKLGLMPGGGGTVRLPRLLGIQPALQLMAEGTELRPSQALAMGLVTGVAPTAQAVLDQARAWARAHPAVRQPWDEPRFRFPGGDSRSPAVVQMFSAAPAVANARSWGNLPALQHLMSSVFEGGLLGVEPASTVESRCFAACAVSPACRHLIQTLWFQLGSLKKGRSRPAGQPPSRVARLGVLGAGMMGAGIAHAAARRGLPVVLLDRTLPLAEKGKASGVAGLDRAVKQGRLTPAQRDQQLQRITPTDDFAALADCDLVIEAVFEDRALKAEVTQQAEAWLGEHALVASNTSTLPITGLAQASRRPASFIGLHFFSPVDRMPLVEIIPGQDTSAQTLARAFDFVLQLGKTPIVVGDRRGFYTSRVFATYVLEGVRMLQEGVHPRSIEVAGQQAGMPMPPLALQDEVSLSLTVQVADQTRDDQRAAGETVQEHPALAAVRQLCALGRVGRKAGRGFYDWGDDGRRLWSGLAGLFPLAASQPPQQELIDRLLFVQALEAARCFDEGVVRTVAEANVGSVMGWGFAPFHGGTLQFLNAMGLPQAVARAQALAARHGPRFDPPAGLLSRVQRGDEAYRDA